MPRGIDLTCGAVLLSCPTPYDESGQEAGVSSRGACCVLPCPCCGPVHPVLALALRPPSRASVHS